MLTPQISISNIAWNDTDSLRIYELLSQRKIQNIEIAPLKTFSSISPSHNEINNFLDITESFNLKPCAMQSLLFGQPDLKLFSTIERRRELLNYCKEILFLGNQVGVTTYIFGCPINRNIPDNYHDAQEIAFDFFQTFGDMASDYSSKICIEPNPSIYGTNFLCTTFEAIDFVKKLSHKSVFVNFDTGAAIYNHEDPRIIFSDYMEYIGHVHISEPYLAPIDFNTKCHYVTSEIIKASNYRKLISIEMKESSSVDNYSNIMTVIDNVLNLYSWTNEQ